MIRLGRCVEQSWTPEGGRAVEGTWSPTATFEISLSVLGVTQRRETLLTLSEGKERSAGAIPLEGSGGMALTSLCPRHQAEEMATGWKGGDVVVSLRNFFADSFF